MPATKNHAPKVGDTYLKLIQRFPLTHIRDDAHLDGALSVIRGLLESDLDDGGRDYLDVLTDLVEAYEAEHHPIPAASEADVLRYLMEERGLSQSKLHKQTGIAQSTISEVLGGTRELTKDQVVKLARFFRVPAAVFLPG